MDPNDQRKHSRYESEVELSIFTQDKKIPAKMFDIGDGGIGVTSPQAVDPGTKVYITLAEVEDYAIRGLIKGSFPMENDPNMRHRLNIEAETIIWTDFKAIGFPDRSELVAKVLSIATNKPNVLVDLVYFPGF